jgi:hypothetical protein
MGGQTLTCAICRSGISGLDLFFATSTGFGLLGLGGWWVGQCRVLLGGWQLGGWSSQDRLWLKAQGSRRPNEAKSVVSLNKSTRTEYALRQRICTYSENFFMAAFFSLRARGFLTAVLVAGGGFTPADCEVSATAMVTIFAEAVCWGSRRVRPSSFCGATCWNIIPGEFGCSHLLALGVGWRSRGTAKQIMSACDNFDTWGVRLHTLYVWHYPMTPRDHW